MQEMNELKNVLIVEDDTDLQAIYYRMLHGLDPNINIKWVSTANEALAALEDCHFDLMIADIVLPNMVNGVDLWKELSKRFPDTAVLLTSAIGVRSYLQMVRDNPVCPPFLAKPFRIDECQGIVQHLLYPYADDPSLLTH